MDMMKVTVQLGISVIIVEPAKTINTVAQISSGGLDILNTLQNRKKCRTTTAMIMLIHHI